MPLRKIEMHELFIFTDEIGITFFFYVIKKRSRLIFDEQTKIFYVFMTRDEIRWIPF